MTSIITTTTRLVRVNSSLHLLARKFLAATIQIAFTFNLKSILSMIWQAVSKKLDLLDAIFSSSICLPMPKIQISTTYSNNSEIFPQLE